MADEQQPLTSPIEPPSLQPRSRPPLMPGRRRSIASEVSENLSNNAPEERPDFPCAPDLGNREAADPTTAAGRRDSASEKKPPELLSSDGSQSPGSSPSADCGMKLTQQALLRVRRSILRTDGGGINSPTERRVSLAGALAGGRGGAGGAAGMYEIIKKAKEERDRQKKTRRTYTVLSRSQETIEHLESALRLKSLSPDASWRRWWDLSIILLIAFHWFMVPLGYVISRDEMFMPVEAIDVVEHVGGVIFLVDIALRFRTGFIEPGAGLVVDEPRQIQETYLLGDFPWDLLAGIPLDVALLWGGGGTERMHHFAEHLRLFKVFRVQSLFSVVNNMKLDKNVVNFQYNIVPNIKMAFYTVIAIHVIAVVFMRMNRDEWDTDENGTATSKPDMSYTTSMYWTLYTVTSVGYGDVPVDTDWKKRFASVLFLVGVIVHGMCMTEIAERRAKADVHSDMRDKMRETLNVMTLFNIPEELQHEVLAFQYHQLHSSVSGAFVKVLETLPHSMRTRVGLYVRVKFICTVPMFADQSIDCLVDLANALQNLVFEPEQKIIKYGDVGKEMFFLGHGFADVLAPNGKLIAVIKPGGFFGERALLTEEKRGATIKSLTYCDTFRLSKDKFIEILNKHQPLKDAVEAEMKQREIQVDIRAVESPTKPDSPKCDPPPTGETFCGGEEAEPRSPEPDNPRQRSASVASPVSFPRSCSGLSASARLSLPAPLMGVRLGSGNSLTSLRSQSSAPEGTGLPEPAAAPAAPAGSPAAAAPAAAAQAGVQPLRPTVPKLRRKTLGAAPSPLIAMTPPLDATRDEKRGPAFSGVSEQRMRRFEERLDDLVAAMRRIEGALLNTNSAPSPRAAPRPVVRQLRMRSLTLPSAQSATPRGSPLQGRGASPGGSSAPIGASA
eukprot:TRINITY_DN37_c9_g1_i1.p1 TRINITY_DN37_c9_g1~~TRINITY_DN37_c9_g1_i1.p1  ORF type:complete len:923 (+),score=298.64 TRINITY_DN37_c9_g1_i1:81-2771(+)